MACLFTAVAWAGQGAADDQKALDELVRAWDAAFNAHDARALAAHYTEDADQVLPTGDWVKGRAAIKKGHAENFAKNPDVKTKTSVLSRRFLTPDVVVEDGQWEDTGLTEKGLPTKGLYSAVLVKQGGNWLIVCERVSAPSTKAKEETTP